MAIPFSNTNYRIPRGFANLLEGLTREVLREQPKDIPLFASKYFSDLLKQREESGFDAAEWGASLEDRFYNNHSFQHAEESVFTPRTEAISHFKGVTVVDGSVKIPQPLDVPSKEEHEVQLQDLQLEDQYKDQPQEAPSEEEYVVHTQEAPSEEEHNLQAQEAPSEEEHNIQVQEAPSEEEHNIQVQEAPSEEKHNIQVQEAPSEEEHNIQAPSEEEESKNEQQDAPSAEEEHKTEEQDVPSTEEEVQPQDVSSSTQQSEEEEIKATEDSTSESHLEEVTDHRESPVIPESTADPQEHGTSISTQLSEEDDKEDEDSRQAQAATMIQAAVRGHLARQEVKKIQKEEAGDKSNISESSDVTSATQDEEQETDRADLDSEEVPQHQSVVSTSELQGILDPGVSQEDPTNLTDLSVDNAEEEAPTSDPAQEEHQNNVQEDGLQVDTTKENEEAADNEVLTGDDKIKTADKGDEITTEDPEPEAAEPPSSGREPDTVIETEVEDAGLIREPGEEPETLTSMTDQSLAEDTNAHIHPTTGEPEEEDQPTEQPIIEDSGVQAAKGTVEDTDEHMTEVTGQSNVENTNDQTTDATGQSNIEVTGDQTTVMEETEHNGHQWTSDPKPDERSPEEENESCRKHQEEALDIALDDPDANAAATKIQAGFRGHMTRKKMKGSDKEGKHKDGKEGSSSAEGSIES